MKRLIIVALMSATAASHAAEADLPARDHLLFYLSFDRGVNADFSRGAQAPVIHKGTSAVMGVSGQGIRFHAKDGLVQLAFDAKGCINSEQGTVAFHFKPDWSGSQYELRYLFSLPGPTNKSGSANRANSLTLFTFRYKQPFQELWLWLDDGGGGNHMAQARIADWKKGAWHHIAATWSVSSICIYIDGKPATRRPMRGGITTPGDKFYLGANRMGHGSADGIMDEFCIYNRPLTESEIGLLTGRPEFTTPHVHLLEPRQNIFYLAERIVPFRCEAGGKVSPGTHELDVSLISEEAKTVAASKEEIGKPVYYLPVNVSAEGKYILRVCLRERRSGKPTAPKKVKLRFIQGPFATERGAK